MKFTNSGINFDNTYLSLNKLMYTEMNLNNTYNSNIEVLNEKLALDLGINIEYLKSENGLKLFSGSINSDLNKTFAQSYSGHQFGHLTTLGDGRALIIGEHVTKSGNRYDIQLKGSGRTPYSRGGDGKATLYSMLREYIISEAMYSLNIPTTRSLSVLKTNELVQREVMHSGAILSRIAKSHIRVGTFVHALKHGGDDTLKVLTDYTINRHYKHLNKESDKYIRFLSEVIDNQSSLIAKWQSVGFIHGVMNTDNVLVSGETIDYGPCAFMDNYDPKTVFSSIDKNGRYAYGNQPYIGSWNLARFTETIMHLFDEDKDKAMEIANNELARYEESYNKYYVTYMAHKLGITKVIESDKELIKQLLDLMEKHKEDFTNTFKHLTTNELSRIPMSNEIDFKKWYIKWQERLIDNNISNDIAKEIMMKNNPVIIPRNNVIEEALIKASKSSDYSLFYEMLEIIGDPFNYSKDIRDELLLSSSNTKNYVTHCGT